MFSDYGSADMKDWKDIYIIHAKEDGNSVTKEDNNKILPGFEPLLISANSMQQCHQSC